MLSNPAYIKFSRESCVEVMCMKDIEQALKEKPAHAATYKAKDPYGDEIECFECCPGVTIAQMLALHEGKPLDYMKGPLMPYTAVVDPHTLADLGGIQRGANLPQHLVLSQHHRVEPGGNPEEVLNGGLIFVGVNMLG